MVKSFALRVYALRGSFHDHSHFSYRVVSYPLPVPGVLSRLSRVAPQERPEISRLRVSSPPFRYAKRRPVRIIPGLSRFGPVRFHLKSKSALRPFVFPGGACFGPSSAFLASPFAALLVYLERV